MTLDQKTYKEVLNKLLSSYSTRYITVETKYTIHHIEKVAGTNSDRGQWKWIGEMKFEYWEALEKRENKENYEEARRSHIDGGDMFPRFMFLTESMINEIIAWCNVRQLPITEIKTPKI